MFIVKLMNEFVHGVLWVCDEDGISTDYDLIDKDEELTKLNEETRKLFDSYYEFDSHDQACWFNEELERKTKDKENKKQIRYMKLHGNMSEEKVKKILRMGSPRFEVVYYRRSKIMIELK